ncbi:MAG TPA: DUF4349 domain-containing protein [Candidatus Limnocylindrales bacterium]|nr:DUF4349 domain-containing protein [Candidatus Limnocylindrales bacterium]
MALGFIVALALVGACASAGSAPLPAAGGGGQLDPGRPGEPGVPGATPGEQTGGGGRGPDENAIPGRDDARIIRTGTMEIEVASLDETLPKARTAIVGLGGYIGASQQSNGEQHKVASITYRIPADRWEEALDALRALGTKLVTEQTQAVEVTGQLVDLRARIDNLRASERALQAIMDRATKISDILEVQGRLTEVRGQIEQLEAQRVHLEDQAGYGTLTVTWLVPVVEVEQQSGIWDPAREIDRATAQLVAMLQGLAGVAIWFGIVGLPLLIGLGIVLGLVFALLRRFAPRPMPGAPVGAGPGATAT